MDCQHTTPSTSDASRAAGKQDADYAGFVGRVQARFLEQTKDGAALLFTTAVPDLWELYLDGFSALSPAARQVYNCSSCRRFIQRFGSLVTIDARGRTVSALWNADDAPEVRKPAFAAMAEAVSKARVMGVFLSSEPVWGRPEGGQWRHLSVTPPSVLIHKRATQTAS